MRILGLTGSIGMGKSTVAAMFARLGVPIFDADAAVRALQGPQGKALPALEALFPGTTGPKGLDRIKLGQAVFNNPVALARLEALMHPMVHEVRRDFIRTHRRKPMVILDVPLLFEKGGWKSCDATIVVSAPAHVQRARVLARPGMTAEKFAAILQLQMPDRVKQQRADFIIPTGRGRRATWRAVRNLVACLERQSVGYCRTCAKLFSTPRRRGSNRKRATASLK